MIISAYCRSPGARALAAAALAAVALGAAGAAEAGAVHATDLRIGRLHTDIQVNADGSYIETTDMVEQLNSLRAVQQAGQMRMPYSASLDDFQIVEAVTLKRDGSRIPVPPASIFTQDGLISPRGTTSFQDIKTTVVVFPQLDVGDSIELRSRLTRRKPMLPGIFTYANVFDSDVKYDDAAISITAPKSYPLSIEQVGVDAAPPQAEGASLRWSWSYRNDKAETAEEFAVDPIMYRPRVLVSSVGSYTELAAAARAAFAGKAAVSPALRATAEQITRGARSKREQVQRIHEWVAHNIRYFAVELNVGGYVPRNADDVLSTRYGDCKDHAVILQALLAARGIASSPALLSAEPIYQLPRTPVLAAFNHVIVYVPELDVYLESNTPSVAYGVLPWPDADKPVLLLEMAQPQARTPPLTAAHNEVLLSTRIRIAADGSASGEDDLHAAGSSGMDYEPLADALAGTDPVNLTKSFLLGAGLVGEGTATATRLSNAGDFGFSLLYELRDYAPLAQPGGVRPVAPMDFLGPSARQSVADVAQRTVPYICMSRDETEKLDLSFPPGVQLSLPQDVTATAPNRRYESSYRLDGSTVHVLRHYVSNLASHVCQPAEHPAIRAVQEKILGDLRSEIRYTPAAVPPAAQ